MEPVAFSTVTAVLPAATGEPGQFEAAVHPEWTIAGHANGGYLLAILGRAAAAVTAHPHVISASAYYLHAPTPGPATVAAEVLRAGRGASQVRVRLTQDGRCCVEALLILAELNPDTDPFWAGGVPAAGTESWADSIRLPTVTPLGVPVPIMGQVDLRIEPSTAQWTAGQPSGAGVLRGWLGLLQDEQFDPLALLFACDAFPPATFDLAPTGWVPTLELTVYVRALPAPGSVRVLHQARLIEAQRVDEACFVWDSAGRLVAHSTQLAAIRLG